MRIGNRLGASARGFAVAALIVLAPAMTSVDAADHLQPVPLGGSLPNLKGDQQFGVYVPTRFGGELTIKTTEGSIGPIKGPDGQTYRNGQDVGEAHHGWYQFAVSGAKKPYTVETSFVQTGRSTRKPWNFYYWPTKADVIHEPWAGGNGRVDTTRVQGDDQLVVTPGGYVAPGSDIVRAGPNGLLETSPAPGDEQTWFPNIYDDLLYRDGEGVLHTVPSPLLKYDQLFRTTARNWEAANSQNQDIARWPGHCLGGAVASIMLNEPTPDPASGMTRDELKSLWAELGENHYNHRIGDYANEIAPGPPRPGFDECDRSVARFHAVLESHVRGEKQALLGNLRAFPPRGTVNEVWNHGIGEFVATYHAIPGKGALAVRLNIELHANSGSSLNGKDAEPRVVKYEYTLVYGTDGKVDETNPNVDWISVGGEAMFAPLNLLQVVESRWGGHNPMVTESNIRSIDLANGGGVYNRRLGSTPPNFQPVSVYEAGRGPMFAREGEENRPFRGLRRLFGR